MSAPGAPSDPAPSSVDYLMVVHSFWPAVVHGGPIYSNLNLCRGLIEAGRRVAVVTTDANRGEPLGVPLGRPVEPFPGLSVTYHPVDAKGSRFDLITLAMAIDLWRSAGRSRVLLAQGLYNLATPLTALIGRLRGRPVVVSPRGGLAEAIIQLRRTRIKRIWLRGLMRPLAGRVLWHATSEQEAAEIRHHFPGARVVVVPNGIELDEYRRLPEEAGAELRGRFALSREAGPVVVALGRIHPKKGLDVLLRAFARLRTEFPHGELLIAGPDEEGEQGRLEALAETLGVARRVHFSGHLAGAEKRLFLAGADLFVLPSRNENFGLVYAEALAAGTPIIASRDTPWEMVERIGCGRWVEGGVDATAGAMRELLSGDLARAGERGRRWVFDTFDHRAVSMRFDEAVRARVVAAGDRSKGNAE